jgi:hypothetical protein
LVYVVLLNWNGHEDTILCLQSLKAATYPRLRIVIVDNGSRTDSVVALRQAVAADPNVILIENDTNEGFARGCNVGMRYAHENLADYVLLLNNDSVVASGFLEPAVEAAEADPRVGLVGGKIYLGRNSKKLWFAGGRIDLLRGQMFTRGFRAEDVGQYERREETGFVTGALMLIKRAVIDTVGFLPAEYFFGQEEWDYSMAVKRAGFRLLYEPRFVTCHLADGSHSNSEPKYVYNGYRNKLMFQQKYLPRLLWWPWLGVFSVYAVTSARRRLDKEHRDKTDMDALMFALQQAIRDHLKQGSKMLTENDLRDFEAVLQARTTGDRR